MHKDFEKLQQAVEELLKISEGKILFEYAAALEHLRTMVRRIYDKHETGGKVSLIEMGKYDRLHKMEQEIEKNLKQLYKKNGRLMDETLKNIFVLTRDTTLQSVAKGVPEKKDTLLAISKKLDIDATVNEKMAGLHWAERMGKHRSDVIYGVNKTLKEGLAQGSTYKELSDRLKKELEGNVVQPMRIIRTESGRVYAKTQQESLDRVADAGIQMVKTWKSSKDERVRSQHQEMEGVTIPYEEEFTLPDGTKTKAPRLSGAPQHDIHCRCFITIDLADRAGSSPLPDHRDEQEEDEDEKKEAKMGVFGLRRRELLEEFDERLKSTANHRVEKLLRDSLERAKIKVSLKKRSFHRGGNVYLSKNANSSVLAHELFHEIDRNYGIRGRKDFAEAIQSDMLQLAERMRVQQQDIEVFLFTRYPEAFRMPKNRIRFREEYAGISDILNGMSKGEIKLGFGHSPEYWGKSQKLEAETWAQYGKMLFENRQEVLDTAADLFPNTSNCVVKIIKELVDDVSR
ncbi:MAG: phage minor head protein [Peptostreptococcaceae bacterium]|nr:phage minor head protein [Peptostreptococcaceae bacterium]